MLIHETDMKMSFARCAVSLKTVQVVELNILDMFINKFMAWILNASSLKTKPTKQTNLKTQKTMINSRQKFCSTEKTVFSLKTIKFQMFSGAYKQYCQANAWQLDCSGKKLEFSTNSSHITFSY